MKGPQGGCSGLGVDPRTRRSRRDEFRRASVLASGCLEMLELLSDFIAHWPVPKRVHPSEGHNAGDNDKHRKPGEHAHDSAHPPNSRPLRLPPTTSASALVCTARATRLGREWLGGAGRSRLRSEARCHWSGRSSGVG